MCHWEEPGTSWQYEDLNDKQPSNKTSNNDNNKKKKRWLFRAYLALSALI